MAQVDIEKTSVVETRAEGRTSAYSYYVLGLLTLTYGMAFLDRGVVNLVLDPIKKEFDLSDTSLGLISGLGFVTVYSTLGIILGRVADRVHRVGLLTIAFACWSVLTGLTSLAGNVWQLVLCRLGVAAAESPLQGPAQSLIADHFTADRRPRALSVYSIGPYLGVFLGFNWAGFVTQYYGWRAAFWACGIPGLVLAAVLWLTVKEPTRGRTDAPSISTKVYPIGETMRFLLGQRTFVLCVIGFTITSYTNFAMQGWAPAFLGRVHHLPPAQIGMWAGTIKGLVGMCMAIAGGFAIEQFKEGKYERWRLLLPAICSLLGGPAFLLFVWPDSFAWSMVGLVLGVATTAVHGGAVYAAVQAVSKVRMRSLAGAICITGASFVASGFAPLAIGALNDWLAPSYGPLAVRYSLLTACATTMIGALCLWAAAYSLEGDRKRAQAPD